MQKLFASPNQPANIFMTHAIDFGQCARSLLLGRIVHVHVSVNVINRLLFYIQSVKSCL